MRKPTFNSLACHVLELKKLNSQNTYLSASVQLRRLIAHFGKKPVREITEFDWNQYILLEQTKKPGRKMFDDRKYMRMVMLYAHREGHVSRKIRLNIPDLPSDVGREITPEEVKRLLFHANPELRFQINIALNTGMRLREMLRLRWEQFDWSRHIIRLSSKDTKTRRGREIPLTDELFLIFEKRFKQSLSLNVFPNPKDHSRPQNNNRSAWRRAKRLAKIKVRWHDWRHTCASRMLRRGVRMYVARAILGMSEQVLTTIYSHVSEEDLRKAVESG